MESRKKARSKAKKRSTAKVELINRKELEELIDAGKRMYFSGLAAGSLGAIGVKLSSGKIAITSRESCLGFLGADDLIVMNGRFPGDQKKTPPEEAGILFQVLKKVPDCRAVLSLNSPYTMVLSHRKKREIEGAMPYMERLGGVSHVPYYRPGTAGLAGAVASAMQKSNVVVVEGQGAIVRGATLREAIERAEALEAAAQVFYLLSGNGRTDG